ncbi:MAG: hypothetical protein ACAI44_15130 [Candidatus Sericytochromatia bacterium]
MTQVSNLTFQFTRNEYSSQTQKREDQTLKPEFQVQVRELKDGVSIEQAAEATKNNGFDEVFFSQEGKNYVAFTTDHGLISQLKSGQSNQSLKDLNLEGKAIKLVKLNDETNSFFGGAWQTAKSIGRAVVVKPYELLKPVLPNAATAGTFAGGVLLGALTRAGDISGTTRIGLAIGAAGGVGTVRHLTDKGSPAVKAAKATATGVASVALGAATPEIIKLIAKIPIPDIVGKGLTIAGTAAAVGGGIAIVGGGIAAATREAQPETFDAIAK